MKADLKEFEDIFPINWTTLLLGLEGPGNYLNVISTLDVVNYVEQKVNKDAIICNQLVMSLSNYSDDKTALIACLRELIKTEDEDMDVELKKWQLYLLKKTIASLPEDPIHGLIMLTDFWEKFDYPENSPHKVQGKDVSTHPNDYYTKDNYIRIVQQHENWLKNEIVKRMKVPVPRKGHNT